MLTSLKDNLNVPNTLSLLRILILFPFVIFVKNEEYIKAGLVLAISGLTDLIDGYIARKLGQVTRFGAMLDPTADKLTLMTVMVCVSLKFKSVLPFMVVLVLKEVSMLVAGAFLLGKGQNPSPSKWYGKLSTVVFYVSVTTIICIKAVWNLDCEVLNVILMSITCICMMYSLWRYFRLFMFDIKKSQINLKN